MSLPFIINRFLKMKTLSVLQITVKLNQIKFEIELQYKAYVDSTIKLFPICPYKFFESNYNLAMESNTWNGDVKVSPDARYLLYKFLNGNFGYKSHLSYQTIIDARPSLKKYNKNTI